MPSVKYAGEKFDQISDLQIGVGGRLRVRVLSSEHAHFEKFRPLNLQRVLRTENSYSYSDLKVANVMDC